MKRLAQLTILLALALGIGAYLSRDVGGICAASLLGMAAGGHIAR